MVVTSALINSGDNVRILYILKDIVIKFFENDSKYSDNLNIDDNIAPLPYIYMGYTSLIKWIKFIATSGNKNMVGSSNSVNSLKSE